MSPAHYDEKSNVCAFQIRSSLLQGQGQAFLDDLLAWCLQVKAKEIIVLASSNAEERVDSQLSGSQLRFYANKTDNVGQFKGLDWTELEKRERFPGVAISGENDQPDAIFMPGAGYAKKLAEKAKELDFSATILIVFCSV